MFVSFLGSWARCLQSCGPNYLFKKSSLVQHDRPQLPTWWIHTKPRTWRSLSWKGPYYEKIWWDRQKCFYFCHFTFSYYFPPSFRWLSQKDKLQASPLACVTHNTSIAHCKCRMSFSYCRRLKVITYFNWKNHTTVANKAQVSNRPRMIKHIFRPCFLYSLFFCIINAISI